MSHLSPEQVDALAAASATSPPAEHLASCPECRGRVADARGRRRLLAGLVPYTLSDMAFGRAEARLLAAVDEGALGPRWFPGWRFVALAVGVAVVGVVALRASPEPGPKVVVAPPARPVPVPVAFLPLTVLGNPGHAVRRTAGAAPALLEVGEVLAAGASVQGGPLLLAPDADAALTLRVAGDLDFGGVATVSLEGGMVAVAVQREAVSVRAGGRTALATEAVFSVSRTAAEVVVDLGSGELTLVDSDGATRRLTAPARARWTSGPPESTVAVGGSPAPVDVALAPRPWSRVDFTALPGGSVLSLDGVGLGTAPLVALLSPGRHRLTVAAPGKGTAERFLDLVGGRPLLVPALAPTLEEDGAEPSADAVERLGLELRGQVPKLRACYEKWLKATPGAEATVSLSLSITARGRVKSARLSGHPVPAALSDCLTRTARTLVLSPIGATREVELPLVLRPR